MRRSKGQIYRACVKRTLDIIFSLLLLLLLCLPMLIIAVAIRSDSSGRAIFSQRRCGRRGKEFICYKFRTMYESAPKSTPAAQLCGGNTHITRVGRILRKTSLDELPQLFNVLRGDMSLVGPRPLIREEGEIHEWRMRRGVYELRPGITGMAQINGRNLISNEEKLRQDTYYLNNVGILLDAKILFATLHSVLRREGIDAKEVKENNEKRNIF